MYSCTLKIQCLYHIRLYSFGYEAIVRSMKDTALLFSCTMNHSVNNCIKSV